MKITHLFIDLDGTLLASDPVKLQVSFIRHLLRYLKKEHGLNVVASLKLLHLMRKSLEKGDEAVLNEHRMARVFARRFSVSEEQALKDVRAMVVYIFSHLRVHFRPIAGALEFIRWSSERYHLTLATNPVWPKPVVLSRLGWAGIEEAFFKMITTAETMHFCKPDLGYYRELLTQTMVDKNSVLMIGDSMSKDLPASKIGIPVFILDSNGFKKRSEVFMTGNFDALRQYLENLG